jgi:two-component system, NarL family, response regulator NreC
MNAGNTRDAGGKAAGGTDAIRILLAEDHMTVREGLKLLISSQPDMLIVGDVGDGREAVAGAKELQPDVVVMDITMPEMNGLQATKALMRDCPHVKVLTLTRHTDDGFLQQLLRAGAAGYVLKQSAATELVRAIRAVAAGKSYLDPAVTEKVTANYIGRRDRQRATPDDISEREAEVLRLIAWGHSNKEVAERLEISVKTVEAHKANCMRKLGLQSRVDIIRYAVLRGWLTDK